MYTYLTYLTYLTYGSLSKQGKSRQVKANQLQTKKSTKFSLSQVILPNNLHRSGIYTPYPKHLFSLFYTVSPLYFLAYKGII